MSHTKEDVLTLEEQVLIARLKSFRVPEMANMLESQLKDPNANLSTFFERLSAMVDSEWLILNGRPERINDLNV